MDVGASRRAQSQCADRACRNRLFGDRRQEMGSRNTKPERGSPGVLQPLRRRESAIGCGRGSDWTWLARAADPRSGWPARSAGSKDDSGSAVSLPALRRANDGAAAGAHRPPPLFGVRHRTLAVSVWHAEADFSLRFPRCPFRHKARSPQIRTLSFTVRPPDLRRLSFGHRGFAVFGPLAPLDAASDPILVHRPTVSLPASFPRSVALTRLRFASIRMTSFRRDLHP